MTLDEWLKKNNVLMKELCHRLGCSRSVLWKVKKGLNVDTKIAEKIEKETSGAVIPISAPKGRPRIYEKLTGRYLYDNL